MEEEKTFDVGAVSRGLRNMADFVKSFREVEGMVAFVGGFEKSVKEKTEATKALNEQIQNLGTRKTRLEAEVASLSEKVTGLKQEVSELNNSLISKKGEIAVDIEALEAEKAKVQGDLDNLKAAFHQVGKITGAV